jgi:exodeoxyribonuclease III
MKIATFNINNINRRLPNLLRWLRAAKPDAVCLQELKSTDADFPLSAIEQAGYGAVWQGQKTWNGVAILARNAEPVLVRTELPGDPNDKEARYIEAAINGIIVTATRSPGRNLTTSWPGSSGCNAMPRNSSSRRFRWCWPATTMSPRRRSIFIRPNPGTRMR